MRDGKRITPDGRKNKIGLQKVARMDTVRVVVADDNIQLRDMVAEYLQEQNGIEVVGTAGDGVEKLRLGAP